MKGARTHLGLLGLFLLFGSASALVLSEAWEAPTVVTPQLPELEARATASIEPAGHPLPLMKQAAQAPTPAAKNTPPETEPVDGAEAPVDVASQDRRNLATELVKAETLKLWLNRNRAGGANPVGTTITGPVRVISKDGANQIEAVTFKYVQGTVSGQVLDPWGNPVEGATVTSSGNIFSYVVQYDAGGSVATTPSPHSPNARTDADGRFTISVSQLAAGDKSTVTITAHANGFSPSEPLSVALSQDGASSGHVLRVREMGGIEGRVVDENGRGIPGATVTAVVPGVRSANQRAETDAGGNFRLSGVPAGAGAISVGGAGVHGRGKPTPVVVRAGTTILVPDIVADVSPSIAGKLLTIDGKSPGKRATIKARDRNGKTKSTRVTIEGDGQFALELAPGSYELEIQVTGYLTARSNVFVGSGREDIGVITLLRNP